MHFRFATLRRPARVSVQAIAAAALFSGTLAFSGGSAFAAPNAAIVVDAKSGKVLYSSNPDAKRHPASLTKMMTLYMLFESIDSGKTSLKTKIKMSSRCAGQAPSKLGIKAGGRSAPATRSSLSSPNRRMTSPVPSASISAAAKAVSPGR
jgi:D-alanyl-D-alanine carboxypeptidase